MKIPKYPKNQVNYIYKDIQRIEISRGCPHNCPFCYEDQEIQEFPIPQIIRNKVQILDMNFLAQSHIINKIKDLGSRKVNSKVVYYELVCGLDHRLLTQEIANSLKLARFIKIRIAWDYGIGDQYKIKDTLNLLLKAGYKPLNISCFMIVNWRIPYKECMRKLDLLKVWNIKVCDCCWNGGYKQAKPKGWTKKDMKDFRSKCRKHNQMVLFKIDPELKKELI